MRETKRITSGIVFKCKTTRLGQTIFDACKENQRKKKEMERQKNARIETLIIKWYKKKKMFLRESRLFER